MITELGGTAIGLVYPPWRAAAFIEELSTNTASLAASAKKQSGSCRGNFAILEAGLQLGAGIVHPGLRAQPTLSAKDATFNFLRRISVQSFLHDTGAIFQHYFPRTEGYYQNVAEAIAQVWDHCQLPLPGLPFTSFTLNVDDQCICLPHIDGSNLVFGLCLICPLGAFDHTKGGHLILHDLRIVLEVAAGSMVLIPSAALTHENVGIGPDETRHAITAYTPASYFRYYEEGFRKVPERTTYQKVLIGLRRWTHGIRLFPHVSEWM